MRKLVDVNNVDAPDGDYPKGRVRDKVGATLGTEYTEILHGDMIQMFQRLVTLSGITENDLPDNVTNGYQIEDALRAVTYKRYTNNVTNSSVMTTGIADISTFVPDANQSFTDIKVTFSCRVSHQLSGVNEGLTFKVNVGGVDEYDLFQTVFTDGRNELVSFSTSGIAYTAGDIVKITGQLSGNTCNLFDARVTVEGINE